MTDFQQVLTQWYIGEVGGAAFFDALEKRL